MYEKKLYASWADMDFNAHMRNTAYLDKAGDVRMMFFAEHGFPMSEFLRLRIGPVITKDEIEYFREVNLLDELKVNLAIAGLADDGSRWLMRNEFFRPDGKIAAIVMSMGGWLDLSARKIVAAPEKLFETLESLAKTGDFKQLDTRIK
ncbi:putative thioesterase [Syntrophobacter sp. SbD1]|nr:putative thioesterase [Syntrophobacter sp. SbD1]